MVGLYFVPAVGGWRRLFQTVGSTLLLAAIVLCGLGFLLEPWLTDLERPYSRLGIYGTMAALVFSLLAAWPARRAGG
jgi:nitric oxide reductase large subunit